MIVYEVTKSGTHTLHVADSSHGPALVYVTSVKSDSLQSLKVYEVSKSAFTHAGRLAHILCMLRALPIHLHVCTSVKSQSLRSLRSLRDKVYEVSKSNADSPHLSGSSNTQTPCGLSGPVTLNLVVFVLVLFLTVWSPSWLHRAPFSRGLLPGSCVCQTTYTHTRHTNGNESSHRHARID